MRERKQLGYCDPMVSAVMFCAVMLDRRLTREQRERLCLMWNEDVKRNKRMKETKKERSFPLALFL